MSRRERALLILGIIGAVGLVIYPMAHRISTAGDSASAAQSSSLAAPSASTTPTPARVNVTQSVAPTPYEPSSEPINPFWAAEATRHRGANGGTFVYGCPPDGTFAQVWGTDIYTDDSSVCTAGVHRGAITRERGGWVRIRIRAALAAYVGTTRNGVTTDHFGPWDGSYEVVVP